MYTRVSANNNTQMGGGMGKPAVAAVEMDTNRGEGVHEEEEEMDISESYIPPPPDGGWGWVIVAASFISNFVVDGVCYSFGVFLVPLTEHFNSSRGLTSLIGSLLPGVYLLAGPIVSALANKFGCRSVTIAGSLLTFVAFLASVFSPCVGMMIAVFGVLGGFGFGLIYLPAVIFVGYYFERKRALATGIAVCGSGVGTLLMAPFCNILISSYGWQGAVLIISAIVLNCTVCGALMRPLKPSSKQYERNTKYVHVPEDENHNDKVQYAEQPEEKMSLFDRMAKSSIAVKRTFTIDDVTYDNLHKNKYTELLKENEEEEEEEEEEEAEEGARGDKSPAAESAGNDSGLPSSSESNDRVSPDACSASHQGHSVPPLGASNQVDHRVDHRSASAIRSPAQIKIARHYTKHPQHRRSQHEMELEVMALTDGCRSSSLTNIQREGDTGKLDKSMSASAAHGLNTHQHLLTNKGPARSVASSHGRLYYKHTTEERKREYYARPMYREDIFYAGSIQSLQQYQSQHDMRSYLQSITHIPQVTHSTEDVEVGEAVEDSESSLCTILCPTDIGYVLRNTLDLGLFTNISFTLICISNIFGMIGFYTPFVYMTDKAVRDNLDSTQAALLISIIGGTNTVGRLFFGWLVDHTPISALTINNVCLLISGFTTILTIYCSTTTTYFIVAATFGAFSSAYISLTSIILVDIAGLQKLTNAFGLVTFFRGISSMAGAPISGALFDAYQDYTLSFLMAGGMLIMASLVSWLITLIEWCKGRKYSNQM